MYSIDAKNIEDAVEKTLHWINYHHDVYGTSKPEKIFEWFFSIF